ncbi:hypothetical protein ACHAXH_001341 [Discostella pseudostelligera]|jgi:hypothetical protein
MNQQRPTEIDSLLSNGHSSQGYDSKSEEDSVDYRRRRRSVVAGATIIAGTTLALSLLSSHLPFIPRDVGQFDPREQRGTLQVLTENALSSIWPNVTFRSNGNSHYSRGKVQVIDGKKNHQNNANVFRCTSQVMIMRHCDKEVKVDIHGHKRTTDMRDKHGDRHCNAKGKARSEYIATLFVDHDNYHELLDGNGYKVKDGIPPVPMVKSTFSKVHSSAASKKPQFPVPLKLYALSAKRPSDKPSKEHANYREIETITPLSNKFHLDVDERFGVEEEGLLAKDFFQSLSESVTQSLKMKSPSSHNSNAVEEGLGKTLCNGGVSVVNWKHSRIPILARAMGCGIGDGCPRKYKSDDFDTLWLLTFQYTLLLGEVNPDALNDIDPSPLALMSLSLSSSTISQGTQPSSLRQRHLNKNEKLSNHVGSWKVTAKLVNEGFEPH